MDTADTQSGGESSHAHEEDNQGTADHGVPDPSVDSEPVDYEAAARDAFFEGHEDELVTEDSPDSHLEAGEEKTEEEQPAETEGDETPLTEFDVKYSLDDLRLPGKYKADVAKKIETILGDAKSQAGKLTEGYSASNAALARAFVDVIRSDDPLKTLHEYAKEALPAFGLSTDLLQNLEKRVAPPANQDPNQGNQNSTADIGNIQERLTQELSKIEEQYWPQLENESDPKRAREIFSQMERKKMALMNAVNTAQQKAVLMAFYNKLIKPQHDEYAKIKADTEASRETARRTEKVSYWNKADQELSKKYKDDWPRYRPKVKDLLKTRYSSQKSEANTSGKGHQQLMEDLYLLVSRQEHLSSAKKPQLGRPGVRPQGKHIKTQPADGMTIEQIKRELWSDIIPADSL